MIDTQTTEDRTMTTMQTTEAQEVMDTAFAGRSSGLVQISHDWNYADQYITYEYRGQPILDDNEVTSVTIGSETRYYIPREYAERIDTLLAESAARDHAALAGRGAARKMVCPHCGTFCCGSCRI